MNKHYFLRRIALNLSSTFILLGLILLSFTANSQTVTIGAGAVNGTTGSNIGIIYRSSSTSAFDFSNQYVLYTAAELSAAGIAPGSIINSVAWYKSNAFGTDPANTQSIWNIYMANSAATPSTTWSSGNFATQSAGATLVYSNTSQVIPSTIGWVTLTLTSPFIYTGGSLEIGSQWDCSLYAGGPTTGGFAWQRDLISNVCVGGSNSTSTITMANQTARPQIQISYVPGTPCSGAPVAGSAVSSANPVCPSINYSISLSGNTLASGLTYQWQSSPDNTTWTNIPGATFANYTLSQTADTYYRCIVTCNSMSDTTAGYLVTTNNFLNCYCASNATSTADEEILNVSLGTLNNSSTCTSTGGPGSVLSQYSNFTALTPPDLAQGVAYPMSVQAGTCGGNFSNMLKVWIDFNQNGLFTDPGENVYAQPAAVAGPHIENFTFTIPLTAALGLTRMRVVLVETTVAGNINPCGTYTWGETEDYFVNIAPVPTCPQPIGLQSFGATTTTVDLDWTPVGVETQWQLQYGPQGFALGTGTIVTVNTNSNTLLGSLTPNTFYQVYVRAICGPGDTSFWAPPLAFNTYGLGQYMEINNDCHPNGYMDISLTGTSSILNADGVTTFPVPFPMYFQQTLINSYLITNNGVVLFNSNVTFFTSFNANTIATNAVQGLYPFWDDMEDAGGLVYWEVLGTSPNQRFVVQWDKKHDLYLQGDTLQYQIVMEEATGEIYYQYKTATVGSATYNNGASATVGLKGPSQNFPLSFNSPTYLTNNACVKFYYTNCPKIQNLLVDYIFADEVSLSWTAGISNETNWTIIYGPAGFDPTTSGTTITVTSTSGNVIAGLTQNTLYDFYVYADCTPSLQSFDVMTTINTLPFCSNPSGITTATAVDSVFTAWNWTTYPGGAYPATGFNLQYGDLGFTNGTGTVVANSDLTAPYNDTTFNAAFLSGGVYQMYVQAVCGVDTSSYIGPFNFTMPLTNDSICGAEMLPVDGMARYFNNTGATAQVNENVIAPPATGAQTTDGWLTSNVNFTTWFTFVAPASGSMRLSGVDAGFNGQMAVYDAASCSPITSLVLVGANDDEIGGTSSAPNFTVCGLTPGVTYFLMHDSFSTSATGVYSVKLSSINLDAGSTTTQIDVCLGDTIDLFNGIAGQQAGGNWLDTDGTFHIVNGNLFNSNGLASGVYNFEYRLEDGCAYDSTMASVNIFPPSSAGIGGTLTICKNQPTNLLNGLSGIVNTGGSWTDPNSAVLANADIVWGTLFVPGNYNYTYTVGNGVCPDASTVVTIIVSPACDWLGLEDLDLAGIKFFPNPTNDVMNIEADGLKEDLSLELTDMNGKILWTGMLANGAQSVKVDVTNFERGVYILKLSDSKSSNTIRVVKN